MKRKDALEHHYHVILPKFTLTNFAYAERYF
jgi:hypothetical protein